MKRVKFKPLYWQIVFTVLAFTIMVFLSYKFNSGTVRENMNKNAESVLSFTNEQIDAELISYRILLESFAQTVQQMIIDGNIDNLQNYINIISRFVISEKSGVKNINGLYGYFETVYDDDVFLNGINWVPPEGYSPTERGWYKNAIANCGEITESPPHINENITGEYFITYSRCIHNATGSHAGVVSIDVPLDSIGEIVTNAALNDGGYGMLVSQDLTVISYIDKTYVGMRLYVPGMTLFEFTEAIMKKRILYEYSMKNWKGEDVVAFSRLLPNGWYLVLFSYYDQYYLGTTRMLIVLCILGALLAVALIIVLISLDRAKEKAGEESRQKSAFLANMSHEIRTPINAIVGMTYIGKSTSLLQRKDYCLEKIENASRHLLGVINDVLDMSKIEANMFELSFVEFNFEKLLQRVINIIGFRAEEKKQKISVYIDKLIPRMLINDDQRLAQVITNLLGNAVKFTPEGGSIKLDARFISEEDGIYKIQITISDSGIGITAEQQKRLFNAFMQADTRISRKYGGTGLGLTISKSIVEMMGGKIKIQSEIGKGSSFYFTFNAKRGEKKLKTLSEAGINWNNISVMVIDDEKEVLDYFKEIMDSFGASCDTALSAKEALSLANEKKIHHMYFIDWTMPEMNGIELAKELKVRAQYPNETFILMVCASEWNIVSEKARKEGFEKLISKPLFPSTIADAIAEVIGIPPMEEKEKITNREGIFNGYKILLAEDVEINREIIDTLTEPTLLKMDYAENGLEAVEKFQKSPDYDLIFMDIQMPEMDGYEATSRIRALDHPRAKTVPIIAMTANVFKEDIEKCRKTGMNDHIGKPVDVEEFFNVLQKFLPKK